MNREDLCRWQHFSVTSKDIPVPDMVVAKIMGHEFYKLSLYVLFESLLVTFDPFGES